MSEWSTLRIGDLGRVVTGATPKTGDHASWGNEVDFITPTEMSYSKREPHRGRRLSAEGVEKLKSRLTPAGSILFACIGFSSGKVSRSTRSTITNQQVNTLVPNPKKVNSNFAYYLLRNYAPKIRNIANGSTTPLINKTTFQNQKVLVPALTTQEAIAAVLGALDDKIASNERLAASVDSLVEALFIKLTSSTSECQESTLADIAKVNTQSTKKRDEGKLRYLDISSVGVGNYEWPQLSDWSDAPGRARRLASPGDTVWSTVRPNRRSHALIMDSDPSLVVSTGLAVLTPHNVGPAFLYESTRTPKFQSYLENVAEGSAYPAVTSSKFLGAPISLPPADKIQEFEITAMPLRERAHQATVESRTLAELRDTLLPQLMSGKLRVKDAEKIVEDNV